jgi:hypothetical protein
VSKPSVNRTGCKLPKIAGHPLIGRRARVADAEPHRLGRFAWPVASTKAAATVARLKLSLEEPNPIPAIAIARSCVAAESMSAQERGSLLVGIDWRS